MSTHDKTSTLADTTAHTAVGTASRKSTASRKLDHLKLVLEDAGVHRNKVAFDAIKLPHRALPELNLSDIDMSVEFLGKKLEAPLIISSMTGGSDARLHEINKNLAIAAEATGVALALGSMRIFIEDPEASAESFNLRQYAPQAPLLANLGAVQLNYGYGLEECRAVVDQLAADGLYLHLNPLQEALQMEGNINFAGLSDRIGAIAAELEVPVLIKEVGCGLSVPDIARLMAQGIRYFDIAGAGGTSFAHIESLRSGEGASIFDDWGLSTPDALRAARVYVGSQLGREQGTQQAGICLIASGGLLTGIDVVKSVILGARVAGIAYRLLAPAMEHADAVIAEIEAIKQEIRTTMFLLGAPNLRSLQNIVL